MTRAGAARSGSRRIALSKGATVPEYWRNGELSRLKPKLPVSWMSGLELSGTGAVHGSVSQDLALNVSRRRALKNDNQGRAFVENYRDADTGQPKESRGDEQGDDAE